MQANCGLLFFTYVFSVLLLTTPTAVAQDATGSWIGSIRCSYGSGALTLQIDGSGAVSGSVTNGQVSSGRVSGRSIEFSTKNFFGNVTRFVGHVGNGSMSGTYTQSANSETCRWDATQRVAYGPKIDQRDNKERYIKDARDAIEVAKNLQAICTYADQMKAAEFLRRAALAYRSAGEYGNEEKLKQAATKITRDGGTADQCDARQKRAANQKIGAGTPNAGVNGKESGASNKGPTAEQCQKVRDYARKVGRITSEWPVELSRIVIQCKVAVRAQQRKEQEEPNRGK